jgi:hypothetical protein
MVPWRRDVGLVPQQRHVVVSREWCGFGQDHASVRTIVQRFVNGGLHVRDACPTSADRPGASTVPVDAASASSTVFQGTPAGSALDLSVSSRTSEMLTSAAPNVAMSPAATRSACLAGTPNARNDRDTILSRSWQVPGRSRRLVSVMGLADSPGRLCRAASAIRTSCNHRRGAAARFVWTPLIREWAALHNVASASIDRGGSSGSGPPELFARQSSAFDQ